MKNPKLRILNYVIPLITLLVSIVCYFRLPDQITLSWDLNGAASSYEAKWHLFLMNGMGLVIAILFDVLPHVDPRKKNYSKFEHFYDQFCIFMQLFLFGMTAVTLVENFRPGTVNIPLVITIAIGILFLFIGNELPKVKSNFFMGIRTPWTLCSEENWRRTHRLGGKCFFTAGIILILAAFLPSQKLVFGIMFVLIMVASLVPTLMSYLWYRKGI